MKVIIDRFEGSFALCEKDNREIITIDKSKLPSHSKEGDVLVFNDDSIVIDAVETASRKEKIKKLMDDLWQ